jgi:hypothetical protein
MTKYIKRMIVVPDVIDVNRLGHESKRISIFKEIFEITRSKLTTELKFADKTNFTIVDSEPDISDDFFVYAILPREQIKIIFENGENIILTPGDLFCSAGIEYKEILTEENITAHEDFHFMSVKYAVKEKRSHGKGPNKYKASIVFTDRYEIEVFANDEKEAHQVALEIPFYDWDHIWNIEETKQNEYRAVKSRHSLWHSDDIKVERK